MNENLNALVYAIGNGVNQWIIFNFEMLLLFKILFSLKRVEIQMNSKHDSFEQVLVALKRYFLIERVVLFF